MSKVMLSDCGTPSGRMWVCAVAALLGFGLPQWEYRLDAGAKPPAAEDDRQANAKIYEAQVRPFLARHCLECHGGAKPKGDFRLDRLAPDFADGVSRERWQTVLKRVTADEMPPKAKAR